MIGELIKFTKIGLVKGTIQNQMTRIETEIRDLELTTEGAVGLMTVDIVTIVTTKRKMKYLIFHRTIISKAITKIKEGIALDQDRVQTFQEILNLSKRKKLKLRKKNLVLLHLGFWLSSIIKSMELHLNSLFQLKEQLQKLIGVSILSRVKNHSLQ